MCYNINCMDTSLLFLTERNCSLDFMRKVCMGRGYKKLLVMGILQTMKIVIAVFITFYVLDKYWFEFFIMRNSCCYLSLSWLLNTLFFTFKRILQTSSEILCDFVFLNKLKLSGLTVCGHLNLLWDNYVNL